MFINITIQWVKLFWAIKNWCLAFTVVIRKESLHSKRIRKSLFAEMNRTRNCRNHFYFGNEKADPNNRETENEPVKIGMACMKSVRWVFRQVSNSTQIRTRHNEQGMRSGCQLLKIVLQLDRDEFASENKDQTSNFWDSLPAEKLKMRNMNLSVAEKFNPRTVDVKK